MDCRVHFAFHGCGGNSEDFAKTGYNDLAAANNIIMVYPDMKCWDNEGAIDAEGFNTNTGLLPTALKAMIEREKEIAREVKSMLGFQMQKPAYTERFSIR